MTLTCLGIEGTAHSFGAALVTNDGTVHSNLWDMLQPDSGGIHPREASQHHAQVGPELISNAITQAGISPEDIDLVAFSQGPGLGPCLRTTATIARALALTLSVPLVGVNHCIAHIEIGRMESNFIDPVTVYVSGGNSQIIAYAGKRYRTFGETLDIAIGNMLDTFGRYVGMPFPAGPRIEIEARQGSEYHTLPYSVKGMDFSYSGMLTAAQRLHDEGTPLPDLCYSIQETGFGMIAEVAERAIAHTGKKELLLTGGVARNERLSQMLAGLAKRHSSRYHRVSPSLAGDQGAMIAWTGILQYEHGNQTAIEESVVIPKWRTDEQEINWRT
ncbi:bifunctional N(6)-L-threonylcarbamoyladenine synthase/serine/threonine protein kinase [Candidatus Thorarchaeota archaeon]|nr:MAG: bifunctional N(6)-L-threonylcarbamoyladenine synthase/serine/threonine protein kinase [Candidatus Thorarchaeota archaeon]